MFERRKIKYIMGVLGALFVLSPFCFGAGKKPHVVVLGAAKKVAYSKAGDPSGALANEDSLKIRALLVDGTVKEWTTGEAHEVTDRSFVVRRAVRLNDELPGDKPVGGAPRGHWVWQRGPWLLVARETGHVTALKLPDYDPGISQVSWFRDFGAYCGLTASGKSVFAVVAQLAARKPVLAKKLEAFAPDLRAQADPVCKAPEWQREPLRVTFRPAGRDPASFEVVPGSAVLMEDAADDPDATAPSAKANE
jgi:hypothetical protein